VTGPATFNIYINYTLEHEHTSVEEADTYDYQSTLKHVLEIKETPISLSTWLIMAELGEEQTFYVDITSKTTIYNAKVAPGRNVRDFVQISPKTIGTLAQDDNENVTITLDPTLLMEQGSIVISWSMDQDGYEPDSVNVRIKVSEQVKPQEIKSRSGTGTWLWGRVTGFAALVILITLVPTGGTFRSLSRRFDKFVGSAKKRVDLHCAFSYQMFTLGLLHAGILMYGHYSSLKWNGIFLIAVPKAPFINLGFITIVILIVISILGMFQKQTARALGYKNWIRIHGWLTYGALGLVIFHLLLVGSTFGAPLRALI
jgi:hypothetical protein